MRGWEEGRLSRRQLAEQAAARREEEAAAMEEAARRDVAKEILLRVQGNASEDRDAGDSRNAPLRMKVDVQREGVLARETAETAPGVSEVTEEEARREVGRAILERAKAARAKAGRVSRETVSSAGE